MTDELSRRDFLRGTAALGGAALLGNLLAACAPAATSSSSGSSSAGSGALIRLGIIPLTDCSSVVMAHELGLYAKYGVNVEISKEASWANVRDKLLSGDLEGAHCLFGMPFSVYTGVGGPAGRELPIAMILNNNGQATTLANEIFRPMLGHGLDELRKAGEIVRAQVARGREMTFAMTFPGGTHDLWMRNWLAAGGIPQDSVKIITIPPPQMVANMKVGNMVGYNVGEPWGGVAAQEGFGFTQMATQDMWKHHPEKALVLNPDFARNRTNDLKNVMRAILEASAWLDIPENRTKAAPVVGGQSYVNAPPDVIDARLLGNYDLGGGLGQRTYTDDTMLFSNKGFVNFPRKSHGIWFMSQYVRFGLLKDAPDYAGIANKLILSDLYREVAGEMGVPIPDDDMAGFSLQLDGVAFDPRSPGTALARYPAPSWA